jgi:hypothetical protein
MRRIVVLLALLAAPAAAQDPPGSSPTSDDCLFCHGEPSLTRSDGAPVAVDAAQLAESIHGQLGLACVDCHADLAGTELPHPSELAPAQCASCHDAAVATADVGAHAAARAAGDPRAPTCASCHGIHDIKPRTDQASRTYHLNLAQTCGQCHGGASAVTGTPGGDVLGAFRDSIHGRALERAGLLVAPSCATCHRAHDVLGPASPDSPVHRTHVVDTCAGCHAGVAPVYEESAHGQARAAGNPAAPVCIDCHTAHEIQRVDEGTFRIAAVDRACGTCHRESLFTYRDTFHGQVTELGYAATATCADCHTPHSQLPTSDPRSTVSDGNRVATCRQCHPAATPSFARYDPHADPDNYDRSPALYYSARFMELLFVGVFGFFGVHSTLWFARAWRERRAAAPSRAAPTSDPDE